MLAKILVAVFCTAIGRGIVLAFHLDEKVARMINLAATSGNLQAISWIMAGTLGLTGLAVWMALRLDHKLDGFLNPRPDFASFAYVNFAPNVSVDSKTKNVGVEVFAELENTNARAIKYRARLTGTLNGQPFVDANGKDHLEFDGYASAARKSGLILRYPVLVPDKTATSLDLDGAFQYDVTYFFDGSSATRRTRKTITFQYGFPLKARPGSRVEANIRFLFRDELEE